MLAALCLGSCGGDSSDDNNGVNTDVALSVSPSDISVASVGESRTLDVKASREWAVFANNQEDWISFSQTSGAAGSTSVQVTIKKNEAKEPREAQITVKAGSERKFVAIHQEAALSLSVTSLYSKSAGESFTVNVTPAVDWTTSANVDWITTSKTDPTTLSIVTAANEAMASRSGKVTVTFGTESREVAIEQGSADDRNIVEPLEGYHLVWHDEFSEGTELNPSDWRHEVKNSGWVNHELQNYVNHKSPNGTLVTEIVDGKLHINCFKENGKVYSGRVYAKQGTGWKYGYVEAKIKLPSGKGTWPAFWMMPVNFTSWPHDGEIDIMEEVGYHKDYVSSSLHADGHVHSNGTQVTKEVYCKGAEGEFHIYGMEWTPDYFQFYVDGNKTLYYKNPGTGVRDWPYDAPFYVILNLAWGGDWGGNQGVDESKLPVTMEVDWVRVWQK